MDKFTSALLAAVLVTMTAFCCPLLAQGIDSTSIDPGAALVSFGMECNGSSRYIWRGMACSDDAVVQASGWLSTGDLTFSVWANYDVTRSIGDNHLNEIDYTIEYARSVGSFALTAGSSFYSYRGQVDVASTSELYAELSWEAAIIRPFTRHSVDIDEYSGGYFGDAGVRVSILSREQVNVELETSVGWASAKFNESYFGESSAAIDVATLSLSCSYLVTELVSLTPRIEISELLDRTLRTTVDKPLLVNLGLTVGVEF